MAIIKRSKATIPGLKEALEKFNNLLLSDDASLDELQEVVDFIKENRSTLEAMEERLGSRAAVMEEIGFTPIGEDKFELDVGTLPEPV